MIVGLSSFFLGRRDVVKRLTFGIFGRRGSCSWVFTGLLGVIFHLISNMVNTLLIKFAPGFSNIPKGPLVHFWISRPRIAWLAPFLMFVQSSKSVYFSLSASSILTEFILQAIGAAYAGRPVNFGIKHGFYGNATSALDAMPDAHAGALFYRGAMIWMVCIGFFFLWFIIFC
jgi:hypothetical protein